ncbi:MAG: 5'-nucleotidase C-terminal domain-containing protein, partial [bacterium]
MNIKVKKWNLFTIFVFLISCYSFAFSAEEKQKEANQSEIQETIIGDVVADAMRGALDADVALINAGSLGTGALPEEITSNNLHQVVP